MERFTGLIGIALILGIAYLVSNNKKKINYRLVVSGLALQTLIAVAIMKIHWVQLFFQELGKGMQKIEQFAKSGVNFVYGGLAAVSGQEIVDYRTPHVFVFAFNVTATIILVTVIVAILYHLGMMQKIISAIAYVMNKVMHVSGAEALSNVASAFVGQVEAQVMIRPYLPTMTKSEFDSLRKKFDNTRIE